VRRSRPVPSIPTRWIAEAVKHLNRVNTIERPSGENWGSESESNPAGRVVSRRASCWVTPSGSEAGMIQILWRAGYSPQSAAIARLAASGDQPGRPWSPGDARPVRRAGLT
jgi:hypothetical protein